MEQKLSIKLSKRNTIIYLFDLLSIIFILIFSLYTWKLPVTPHKFPIDIIDGIMILFFVLLNFEIIYLNIKKSKNLEKKFYLRKFLAVIFFIGALITGVISANPNYKTHAEALNIISQQQQAARKGISFSQQEVSPNEIKNKINEYYPEDKKSSDIANKAYKLAKENDLDETKIINEVTKSIPVNLDKWTCNKFGCSFADEKYIWVISSKMRIYSTLLVLSAMILIFFVSNQKYPINK